MKGVNGTPPVTPTSTCPPNGARQNKSSASHHPFTNLRPAHSGNQLHEFDLLIARGKIDQLLEPPQPRCFLLGAGDPSGSHPPIVGRKVPVVVPSGGLRSELGLQLMRHLGRKHSGLATLLRLERSQSCRRHLALRDQSFGALDIRLVPGAARPARREPLGKARLVDFLDLAVDPSKAQRLFDRLFVGNSWLAGFVLVVNEPDFIALVMILPEPSAPLAPVFGVNGFHRETSSTSSIHGPGSNPELDHRLYRR